MGAIDLAGHPVVAAMIAPALFMTATASLIISTSNRMGRIVDRVRALGDASEKLDRDPAGSDFVTQRREHMDGEYDRLQKRSDLIRYALIGLYLAMGCFVACSLTLAVDAWSGHALGLTPTVLAVLGVTGVLNSCVCLAREAVQAMRSNHAEIRFHTDLRKLRRAALFGVKDPPPPPAAPAA